MKKLIALAAIVFFIFSAAYFTSCNNSSDKPAEDTAADSIQQVIQHGEYLATNVAMCIHCHSQRDFTKYSGPVTTGTEGGAVHRSGQFQGSQRYPRPRHRRPAVAAGGQTS